MEINFNKSTEIATLAGGCFWCLEAVYDELKGVVDLVSAFARRTTNVLTYPAF